MAISKNPKVIMTERQFTERLESIRDRNTYYKNKYPDNLCYIHKDGRTSADCVNLVKAILNGYDINNYTVGYYQKNLSNTGDCTEKELLTQCSDVSQDFNVLGNHAEILYMQGHIGVYLGYEVRGTYNVIECASSFKGVAYSYVGSDGIRRKIKGGVPTKDNKGNILVWTHHGKPSKWVEMTPDVVVPQPTKKTYFVKKGDTLSTIAKANNMSLAKLVSLNPQIKNINKINIGQVIYLTSITQEEYYTVSKGDTLGAIARKFNISLNKLLGLNPDIKNPNLIHVGDKIRIK